MSIDRTFLRVNLLTAEAKWESVPQDIVKLYIGGRGFGIRYLYDELNAGVDPLGEENKLLLLAGPLAGTGALSLSRWVVVTKSPLSGTFTRSAAGGDFGAFMAFAGLDFILLEGRASKPVYLYIEKGSCEVIDASSLWGKDTAVTQETLSNTHGEGMGIACIGPAGENLVRYAGIFTGRRSASRGGVGTVMGSKNLKAVVIKPLRGYKKPLADLKAFRQLVREQVAAFKGSMFREFQELGTTGNVTGINKMGMFPTRNFRWGELPSYQRLSSQEYLRITQKNVGCFACPVNCGKVRRVAQGPFKGVVSEGPEYETICAFAGGIDCPDVGFTVAADALCDDLGLDTLSTGSAIALAYEMFQKGLLTTADTNGLKLEYGDPQPAMLLIKKIAHREGIGDVLAEGAARAATRLGKGAEDLAMHVKGLDMAAYDPRGARCMGLNFATSNIGAHATYGYPLQEIFGIPVPRAVDRLADEGNGDIVKINQDSQVILDMAVGCNFPYQMGWVPLEHMAKLLHAATGVAEFGEVEYLLTAGERVYNLERLFNLREGFGRKDDTLPKRMLMEPILKCSIEGEMIRKPDILLDEYYQARGWTKEGIPTPEKLQQLAITQ